MHEWSGQEREKTIVMLENRIKEQNETLENLLTILETYQYKTEEVIKEIRDSIK